MRIWLFSIFLITILSASRTFAEAEKDDINFYLSTRLNPYTFQEVFNGNLQSFNKSNFRAWRPTTILAHGWSDFNFKFNNVTRYAYLLSGDYNIIAVNWSSVSTLKRRQAIQSMVGVSKKIASLIDFMDDHKLVRKSKDLTLVGFDLGAHLMGHVGRRVKKPEKVHSIIGLDASKNLIAYKDMSLRLRPWDAMYVESIQTSAGTIGYKPPLGKATFYPHGGQTQVLCEEDDAQCSHTMAYKLFAASLLTYGLQSIKCSDYEDALDDNCGSRLSLLVRMGSIFNSRHAKGVYYVPIVESLLMKNPTVKKIFDM